MGENKKENIKIPSASGRSIKHKENYNLWNALSFVQRPALDSTLVDYFADGENLVSTKTVLGKNSKHPLEIEMPIIIADMSFGALSETAKLALAKGSTMAGIAASTGEGGILPGEKEFAKNLIVQYSTGRFGWPKRDDYKNDDEFDNACSEHVNGCAAICLKFSQGAKPGQGGLLPAEKVTERIAEIRKIENGKSCHSPACHKDINSKDDLKKKVLWFKKISGDKPVIIKFGAGHIEQDINLAVEVGADIIEIDGSEGGTGAAPAVMLNEVGIPTFAAILRAREQLKKLVKEGNKKLPELVIGGGIKRGSDVAKCIALGADAVMMGIGFMKSMGCTECGICYTGRCPRGIATQDPNLEKNLIFDEAADKVSHFAKVCNEEVKMMAAVCGKKNVHDLEKSDMRCELSLLGKLVSDISGVKMSHEPEE